MSTFERTLATILIFLTGLLLWRESTFPEPPPPPVVVRVTGSVKSPGIVALPAGSRLASAVVACGGLLTEGDSSALPLAQILEDGQTYVVPSRPAPTVGLVSPRAAPTEPDQLVRSPALTVQGGVSPVGPSSGGVLDLNSAKVEDLVTLPGVGPVLAQRIVDGREQQFGGSFRSLEDLATLRGIKGKTLERLKPHLKIEGI